MIAAAQILFSNTRGDDCLDWLLSELPMHTRLPCSKTEWRGFTTVIPQILVETSPVALTIQLDDDPEYVPDELSEIAGDFRDKMPPEMQARLQQCNARLDVMSATPVEPEITDEAIRVHAQTDLDPAIGDAADVLAVLAKLVDGFIMDCVQGRLLCPHTTQWLTPNDII